MPKSTAVLRKKKGRPEKGETPMFSLRLPPETRSAVRAWAAEQEDAPSESVAIRRLVDQALKVKR